MILMQEARYQVNQFPRARKQANLQLLIETTTQGKSKELKGTQSDRSYSDIEMEDVPKPDDDGSEVSDDDDEPIHDLGKEVSMHMIPNCYRSHVCWQAATWVEEPAGLMGFDGCDSDDDGDEVFG